METLSALAALCEGNPSVTSGFPSQRVSDADVWCFLSCQHAQRAEQTVEWQVNQYALVLI